MNPSNGHLISGEKLRQMREEMNGMNLEYIPVPNHLQNAALKKLGTADEAYVSLTSGGKLSKWAYDERKKKGKGKRALKKLSIKSGN